MRIPAEIVKQLHQQTGAGYMDAKAALIDAKGDIEKAILKLREKGILIAEKKALRRASEGVIGFYLHSNERVGVMLEVCCETEFAASTKMFKEFAHNIAMHIAAMNPRYIDHMQIPAAEVDSERRVYEILAHKDAVPEEKITLFIESRLQKYYQKHCLLDQEYFKDPGRSVNEVLVECIAALKENVVIKRFTRYEIGEPA